MTIYIISRIVHIVIKNIFTNPTNIYQAERVKEEKCKQHLKERYKNQLLEAREPNEIVT